jgi:hypothetical protein
MQVGYTLRAKSSRIYSAGARTCTVAALDDARWARRDDCVCQRPALAHGRDVARAHDLLADDVAQEVRLEEHLRIVRARGPERSGERDTCGIVTDGEP